MSNKPSLIENGYLRTTIAHTEILETMKQKQTQIAERLDNDRQNLVAYQQDMHARLTVMQNILDELHDDLKLRKWLMRALKSLVLVIAAILGFIHAPAWIHSLFGTQGIKK